MKKFLSLFDDRIQKAKIIILMIVAVTSLTTMMVAASAISASPLFCGACHEMSDDHAAWERSTHKNVACVACHVGPSVSGLMGYQMTASVSELYQHFTGKFVMPLNKDGHVGKALPSDGCQVCHAMDKRVVSPSKNLKIDHSKHIKNHINCATCHNRVAHPDVAGKQSNIAMQKCFRCHGQKTSKAPGKCSTCHIKTAGLKPASHALYSWLHPVDGKRAQHTIKAKQDRNYCRMCHQDSFCRDCHGMDIPHDKTVWAKGPKLHKTAGRATPEKCMKCHGSKDFCNGCHHKTSDPKKGTWVQIHRFTVNAQGAVACFDCHGPTYCAYCHTTGTKAKSIKGPVPGVDPPLQ